jgi:tetratricopeptide (TPR) repeat protein
MTKGPLWIQRKIADEMYGRMLTNDGSVVVYLIEAPAGMGKTFLARDLGTRLGSFTGYEAAHTGALAWSGILDIYDPDTNSNSGIERRLIEALASDSLEFEDYQAARDLYEGYFKSGIAGSGLEEQRHKIEAEFAAGLRKVGAKNRSTLVFDTIERLESAADFTQRELGFFDDTASVMGWLIFQIAQLQNAVVLLLGREAERFAAALKSAIDKANEGRTGGAIELKVVHLGQLDHDEADAFFAKRLEQYPRLAGALDAELRALLVERTAGNPLLIDIVLQTLLATSDRAGVKQSLSQDKVDELAGRLVEHYKNSLRNKNHATLLHLLALARNGLFPELIAALEPERAEALIAELPYIEQLPFVKVRNITFPTDKGQSMERRTYFLHDAMYAICDDVLFFPEEVRTGSVRILEWYERQINALEEADSHASQRRRPTAKAADLYVQSLFYRMRVDPVSGYQWYLRLTDWAIRSVESSLDMRLLDALGLFLASAGPDDQLRPGQSLSSKIDRENVAALMPDLPANFELDSATLWMRRLSIRGQNDRTCAVGDKLLELAERRYAEAPAKYALAYADFLLWYGQGVMYSYRSSVALERYQRALDTLTLHFKEELRDGRERASLGEFGAWRLISIAGRLYNNIGYTLWVYDGKFSRAVREFQHAINLFQEADIPEEWANSSDNMGRVYASLGYEFRAIQLIKVGLEIRHDLGLLYREALSHNSLAVALAKFARFPQAVNSAELALNQFRRVGVERGIGLGLLTHGEVYRQMADTYRETDRGLEQAFKDIDLAESDLRDALRKFSAVKEPIREVQTRNALACCYRTRLLLLKHSGPAPMPANVSLVFSQGRILFQQAIRQAEAQGYLRNQLRAMQDLAVHFYRAEQYADAEKYLLEVWRQIPDQYKIRPGEELPKVPEADRVDAFYRLLGQVEQLLGAIAFANGFKPNSEVSPRARLTTGPDSVEAMLHYLLGVTYFSRYSDRSFVHRQAYGRIHARFKNCTPDNIREILEVYLPQWLDEYGLPKELVFDLLADVFGTYKALEAE